MFASVANRVRSIVEWHLDNILDLFLRRSSVLHPIEVEKAVCRAIDEGSRVFSRTIYAPNRVMVRMNPTDLRAYSKFMSTYLKELKRTATEHIENTFFQSKGDTEIMLDVIEDSDVHAGSVICEAEFVDEVTEKSDNNNSIGGKA
jgi:hypothetical protein